MEKLGGKRYMGSMLKRIHKVYKNCAIVENKNISGKRANMKEKIGEKANS